MRALVYMICFLALCVLASLTILAVQTKGICLEKTVIVTVHNEAGQLVHQRQIDRSCQMGFGLFPKA